MSNQRLRTYQRDALEYCRRTTTPALFMDMRLGKTLVTLCRIEELSNIKRVLIVAPMDALNSWEHELVNESIYNYTYVTGSKKQRLEALSQNKKYNLTNKESHLSIGTQLTDIRWDCIVLDESTFIKNPKSKVSKFYTKNFSCTEYRFILTGTPRPESDLDFFQQFLFLNHRAFGCDNYWQFRSKYFESFGYDWFPVNGAAEWINRYVSKNAFILNRKDVKLDQPKIRQKRYITIPIKLKRTYKTIEDEFILEHNGESKRTIYSVVQYHWLRQFAGGFIDKKLVWDGKLKVLIGLLEGELKDEHMVIWCSYNHEVELVYTTVRDMGIPSRMVTGQTHPVQRADIFRGFQDNLVDILVIQCECSKFGVDLSAADTVIYYSGPLGLLTRQQTEDRVIKVGDKHPILYIDLIVKNSVDEDVYDMMINKKIRSSLTMNLIKNMQERICKNRQTY